MGEEISRHEFSPSDYQRFRERLAQETRLLGEWLDQGRFSQKAPVAGMELEAVLTDPRHCTPAPVNEPLLQRLHSALLTPELARFNIEFNTSALPLRGKNLSRLQEELQQNWDDTRREARALQAELLMIGILPTFSEHDFGLDNMSAMERYLALNEQLLRLRQGRLIHLDIQGHEHLKADHDSVMLESAATSFQIHMQIPAHRARRYFNASVITSAPLVAVAANAPYLFGHDLWEETRVPLFEQAVELGGFEAAARGPVHRVTFGSGYVRESILELFRENLEHYPVLLPAALPSPMEELPHLRLHNGTLWRWNRPLIGFSADGEPHLRLEQRVAAAAPTHADNFANAAFYYGLCQALAEQEIPPESLLEFALAKQNFYLAARHGLKAQVAWLDGKPHPLRSLILDRLIPLAASGLDSLGVDGDERDHYLGIIHERVSRGLTGSEWQRRFCKRHGRDFRALCLNYAHYQRRGEPVHTWPLEAAV